MSPAEDAQLGKVEDAAQEWLSANGFVPRRIAAPTGVAWMLMALGNGGRKEEEREEYCLSQARLRPFELMVSMTLKLTNEQVSTLDSLSDQIFYGLQLALLHDAVSLLVIQRPLEHVHLSTSIPVETISQGGLAIALRKLGDAASYLDIAVRQATGVPIPKRDAPVN